MISFHNEALNKWLGMPKVEVICIKIHKVYSHTELGFQS